MSDLERIGVSLDNKLLKQFDKYIRQKSYTNRSEAIRDIIRHKLMEQELAQPNSNAVAAIYLIYDHHTMKLSQRLVEIQHEFVIKTICSMHVHLDHHNCMEIIILKGKVSEIQKIADHIVSLKGVKLSKVNLMSSSDIIT